MRLPRCFKKIGKVVLAVGTAYAGAQYLPHAKEVSVAVVLLGAGFAAYTDTTKKEKK